MPTFHLLFALVAYAGNFTHVRCESPAIRYEHLVDRTVHIVNFDVARSLKVLFKHKERDPRHRID